MLPRSCMYKPDAARQYGVICCHSRSFVFSQEILLPRFYHPKECLQTEHLLRLNLRCHTWAGLSPMLRSFDRKLVLAYEGAVLCFTAFPQMIVNLVPVPLSVSSVGSFEVSGGCDFVRKTMDSFKPATASTCVIVDLHGYDCWPALAALEDFGVPDMF